jgi:hypothetical protein
MNRADVDLFVERVLTKTFVRRLALLGVLLSGAFIALSSSAASPDYRSLWWAILPAALLHVYMALRYASVVHGWTRWFAILFAILALSSFVELWSRAFS